MRRSRPVEYKGRLWSRSVFEIATKEQGTCQFCGGSGRLVESIDEERFDVVVFCPRCTFFCGSCKKWVRREGHACQEPTP